MRRPPAVAPPTLSERRAVDRPDRGGPPLRRAAGRPWAHLPRMETTVGGERRGRTGAPRCAPWAALWLLLAVAPLPVAACGSDGDADAGAVAGEGDVAGGVRAPDRSTEPPGSDVDAVRPYIETLLGRYDRVVNEIVAEPAVARHPTDPLVEEYLDLYESGSEPAADLLGLWVERADAGLVTRPLSDAHPATVSSLDGDLVTVSDDEVAFPYCLTQRLLVVGPDGEVQQRVTLRLQRGDGVAVRVDGRWHLREVSVRADTGRCESEQP
jgi:hypothetical protein